MANLVVLGTADVRVVDLGLIESFRHICGPEHVLTDTDRLRTYESDGLRHYRSSPAVAVLPGSAERGARRGADLP